MCRFSDACMRILSARANCRRRRSAKARNRGRRISGDAVGYGELAGWEMVTTFDFGGSKWLSRPARGYAGVFGGRKRGSSDGLLKFGGGVMGDKASGIAAGS